MLAQWQAQWQITAVALSDSCRSLLLANHLQARKDARFIGNAQRMHVIDCIDARRLSRVNLAATVAIGECH